MLARNIAQYFSNASNTTFHNTKFTHVNGNAYMGNSERHGLRLLLDNISSGAFHDAAERGDPPRCHPHTQMAIRTEIMEWIGAPSAMRKSILWMYGPAGSGKTAIAQSIAEECQKQGLLAASFFFGRTAAGRNNSSRFIATIAYQLSRFIPEACDRIISAIEKNPTIFSLALGTQMQVLVIEPLKSLLPSSWPIFIITDGIDECGPDCDTQADLLNVLGTAISELQHIASANSGRPEYEIREAFDGNQLGSLVKRLLLDNNYKPDEDVRLYLVSTFRGICDKHLRLGSRLPSPWPAKADVDLLVSKASGQFIFAATIMKFIHSSRHHPPEQLDIIIGLSAPGNETPFALLDALYHFILASVANLPKVLEILMLLILGKYDRKLLPPLKLNVTIIEALLGITVGTVLVDMHALVFVPLPTNRNSMLRIHHASLYDFLTDKSWSHGNYINSMQGHITLGRRWLKLIVNYPHIPSQPSLCDCMYAFIAHCKNLSTSSHEIADDLASFSLKKLLEDTSDYKDLYRTPWNAFFATVEEQAGVRDDVFLRLRDEFDSFVLGHLSQYPSTLQTLIPAILVYTKTGMYANEMFRTCLYALYPTEKELDHSRRLDSTLLDLYNLEFSNFAYDPYFSTLFQDRSQAGHFHVDGESNATLMKQIIGAAYPMAGRDNHRVEFVPKRECQCLFDSDGSDLTIHIPLENLAWEWLPRLIADASTDLELAMLLHKRALQFDDDDDFTGEHYKIAEISWKYIRRCHIPNLKHTHIPNTSICIVCEEYGNTSIIVNSLPSMIPAATLLSGPRISIRNRLGFLGW